MTDIYISLFCVNVFQDKTLTTITVERLQKRGYESMSTYYLKIAPFLHEPSRHHVIGMV